MPNSRVSVTEDAHPLTLRAPEASPSLAVRRVLVFFFAMSFQLAFFQLRLIRYTRGVISGRDAAVRPLLSDVRCRVRGYLVM